MDDKPITLMPDEYSISSDSLHMVKSVTFCATSFDWSITIDHTGKVVLDGLKPSNEDVKAFFDLLTDQSPGFVESIRAQAVEEYKKKQEVEQHSRPTIAPPGCKVVVSASNNVPGDALKHTSGYMQPRSQGKTFSVPGLHVYKAKPRTVTAVQCGADNFEAMRALAGVRIMEGYTNAFARFLNEASVVVDVKPGWWLVRRDDTPAIITLIPDEAFRTTYDLCE